eukprot:c606_g1_i1.p1 GENE.c606_g1_i1~~c606_g1_i1.p1  ORF type:complete len:529 (-),score=89.33 c606_g1_i1:24-1568(-)
MSETQYTLEEVKKHNTPADCWIVVDGRVLDVTKFARMHPGGQLILQEMGGKDASEEFWTYHRMEILQKYVPRLQIGVLKGASVIPLPQPGQLSQVPYSELPVDLGFHSPYFNESHARFRKAFRAFLDTEIAPHAAAWEDAGKEPSAELFKKLGQASFFACRMAPGPHLKHFKLFGDVKPEEFDYFHELIAHEEVFRLGCPGLSDGLGSGLMIAVPTIVNFAKPALREKVLMPCLLGEKRICLAITEPVAGSDVAGIRTTARKSECGKFYIVNGTKKWITNATFCDFFVTAVVTGNKGIGGMSLLLIEKSEGLKIEPIKTSYSPAAGTGYLVFENVKVPVENLLGEENKGFRCIMQNFNHERWIIAVATNRQSRVLLEESFKWANQRKVFGRPLIDQPVIRNKLARMTAAVESSNAWLELITHQLCVMDFAEQQAKLAGPIALLKFNVTRTMHIVVDEANQIFGGRAISRLGMGQVVERMSRAQKFAAIYGGSEEIMADLGIKQAIKSFPAHSRL